MNMIFMAASVGAPSGMGGGLGLVLQMALLFGVMYFLIIRPQQKRAKEHKNKIEAVQRGNIVVTGGGLIGKVTKVTDDEVEIELASGVRVRSVKNMLTDVRTAGEPAND